MKIAFWSNSPGKSGVTGNLTCISIVSAMYQESEMVLFENHVNINNLGSTFLNQNSYDRLQEKSVYFVENGLGRILSFCDRKDLVNEGMIYRTCFSVFNQRVFYLPTGGMNPDLLEYRLKNHAGEVMNLLEQFYATVCIDLSSSSLESSREILKEADLVVVNLSQNNQQLSHFFRNYSEIREKAFYVIGNYDAQSVITKRSIVERFGLSGSMVGTIPYNRRFADALTKGRVIPFLLRQYSCGKENVNYDFMSAVKETVCLFEQAKENRKIQKQKGGAVDGKARKNLAGSDDRCSGRGNIRTGSLRESNVCGGSYSSDDAAGAGAGIGIPGRDDDSSQGGYYDS